MSVGRAAHRIGEFARRVGVSPELLRAWEQRYGLLQPVRSAGGFRLYTEKDAERVARMRRALADGLSAAEAARVALEDEAPARGLIEDARVRLLAAVEAYDEAALQAVLDDSIAAFGLEPFVRDLILPALAEVGRRWETGNAEVSQEHFASNLIRGRLLALARLWGEAPARWRCSRACQASSTTSASCLRAPAALPRLAHPVPRRRYANLDPEVHRAGHRPRGDRARRLRYGAARVRGDRAPSAGADRAALVERAWRHRRPDPPRPRATA